MENICTEETPIINDGMLYYTKILVYSALQTNYSQPGNSDVVTCDDTDTLAVKVPLLYSLLRKTTIMHRGMFLKQLQVILLIQHLAKKYFNKVI